MKGNYWMINSRGVVNESPKAGKKYPSRKKFGNVFKSKEIAEIALKRVKAVFKRLKSNL